MVVAVALAASRMAAVHVKRFSVKRVLVHTGCEAKPVPVHTGSGFLDPSKIEKSRCLRFFGRFLTSQKSKKVEVCFFFGVFVPLKNRKKSMFALFWALLDGPNTDKKLMFAFFWAFFDGPKFEKTSIRFRFNPVPVQTGPVHGGSGSKFLTPRRDPTSPDIHQRNRGSAIFARSFAELLGFLG